MTMLPTRCFAESALIRCCLSLGVGSVRADPHKRSSAGNTAALAAAQTPFSTEGTGCARSFAQRRNQARRSLGAADVTADRQELMLPLKAATPRNIAFRAARAERAQLAARGADRCKVTQRALHAQRRGHVVSDERAVRP
eukprot:CAMPEP_0119370652 /NCGR_PEP_ID=MMETSP1334-20130426/16988_1 /TAXON_ID=127549 /ORGANISM="Calcidiscus leptoporus, Strain RCC1130" /LENGTH=139 /DNA_ID=CAMNT_0007387759 /DNA_START=42 /DNA_END=458 /DNA_ORIENTATION=+